MKNKFVFFNFLSISIAFFSISVFAVERNGTFTHADIANQSAIVDLHCDTVYRFYRLGSTKAFLGNKLQVNLPALKRAGVKAEIFALWAPPGTGFSHVDRLINIFEKMISENSADMAVARSYAEFESNIKAKKISAILSIEGGHAIGSDPVNLDYFYGRGVRSMSLTWNFSNKIAEASGDKRKPHGGLSEFGKKIVRQMNRLGMIVDISHASDETVIDVLAESSEPVIASHSCVYSLRKFHRNLKDDIIRRVCSDGGVIGINFYGKHLSPKNRSNVAGVADHIDYAVQLGGIDCVALGSDYDGMTIPAKGLENIGKLENLTDELIRRGYTREQIEKIYGLNFLRLFKKVVDE